MNQQDASNLNAVNEQVQKCTAIARELTYRLETFEKTNQETELKAHELARERDALAKRVTELEKVAKSVVATQPEVIVEGLQRWLKSDPDALTKALRNFLCEAVR